MIPKQYISYQIVEPNVLEQEILVAELADFGFDGFEQNDTNVTADGLSENIDKQQTETYLLERKMSFSLQTIIEQNWNEQWEKSFQPIVVDRFCAVRAGFHQPVTGVQHEIIITPKMSFGTGHHATTYMMLQAMQHLDIKGKAVTDFGTGTAILSILAEKMGAVNIIAIDNDDWCIENGMENIQQNNCTHIHLQKASNLQQILPADLILANINRHIILSNLEMMKLKLKSEGKLLISGILKADEQDITKAAAHNGFNKLFATEKNDWLCICYEPSA